MMDGGGAGEVCGEVLKKHLTIGKADKQRDLGLFGEVLTCFLRNFFCPRRAAHSDSQYGCRRCLPSRSRTISDHVRDYP